MHSLLTAPVLVLNANYEPISVCNARRAITLLLAGKVEVLSQNGAMIHSARQHFHLPSVVRLQSMIRAPRPEIHLTKSEIFRRDQYTCQYCGAQDQPLTIDHVFPRHRGGKHVWENVVTACQSCNRRKGNRTLDEVHMPLRHLPRRPIASAFYRFGNYLSHQPDWENYLQGW
ncbi:MAG TPA: HNH endonuclease [Anaerolineales bacterium]|nr:HNH endonuclease [Anaerolineales bacterium]